MITFVKSPKMYSNTHQIPVTFIDNQYGRYGIVQGHIFYAAFIENCLFTFENIKIMENINNKFES